MARDRGQPPKTDKATVIINIKDENDNVPNIDIRKIGRIFLKDGVANVAEDVIVDTPIALVQVSDRDKGPNGIVTCTVVGDVPFQLKPASEVEGEMNKRSTFSIRQHYLIMKQCRSIMWSLLLLTLGALASLATIP